MLILDNWTGVGKTKAAVGGLLESLFNGCGPAGLNVFHCIQTWERVAISSVAAPDPRPLPEQVVVAA